MMIFGGIYVSFSQTRHDCPDCDGGTITERCPSSVCHNGAVYCTACDYSGKIEVTCSSCSGSGSIDKEKRKTCENCKGQRYFKKEQRKPCSCRGGKRPITKNGQTVYIDCDRCSGKGYLPSYYNEDCSVCSGSGYDGYETISNTCSSCSGSGKSTQTCSICSGNGGFPCPTCKGYANISKKCDRCKGNGEIYTE